MVRRFGPVFIGLLIAFFCVCCGLAYVVKTAPTRFACELERVKLEPKNLVSGDVVGVVVCRNNTRIQVGFESLDGTLSINQREMTYDIRGLSAGDVLQSFSEKRAEVAVRMTPIDLVEFGLMLARDQPLHVEFTALAKLTLWGIPLYIPLQESADVNWIDLELQQ